MGRHWLLFTAWRAGKRIASSLVTIDPDRKSAFGRYWGAPSTSTACTSTPATTSRSRGASPTATSASKGGAQGEHKMARGLLPVQTWSAHWLAHPQFARAIDDFIVREGAGVESYLDELAERRPFKDAGGG